MATIDNIKFREKEKNSTIKWWIAGILVVIAAGSGLWFVTHDKKPEAQTKQLALQTPKSVTSNQPTMPLQPAPDAPPPQQTAVVADAPVAVASQSAPQAEVKKQASAPKSETKVADGKPARVVKQDTRIPKDKVVLVASHKELDTTSQALYYADKESCEAAWRAGRVVDYKPTARHHDYGDMRVAGHDKRPLEGDACVLLGAQPGKRWVFMRQGTMVYTRGTEVKFLAECQNDIFEVRYLKKEESKPVTQASVEAPLSQVIPEDKVVVRRLFCEQGGQRVEAPIVNGKAECPPIEVSAPIVINEPVRKNAPVITQAPQVPVYTPPTFPQQAAQPSCSSGDCAPPRKTEAGRNGECRIKVGTNRIPECNFPWKVLRTQDAIQNCGCQILVPNPRQIIGFPDAMPGSPRCLQQKKLWAEIQGLRYSDTRAN